MEYDLVIMLLNAQSCFMEVEKAFIFIDSSVISFPFLGSGTLLVSVVVRCKGLSLS